MHRLAVTFIFVLLFNSEGLTQSFASIEAEVGVNVSSLPVGQRLASRKETTLPVVSPLLGMWLTALPDKKFNVSVGLQFYSQGQHYRYMRSDYDPVKHSVYQTKTTENMKFHQVSTAIVANYKILTRKSRLGISAGYRISNYTSGHYSYKIKTSYGAGVNPGFLYERNVDPFSEDLFVPAKRSRSQVVLGMQYSLGNRWTASASYSVGAALTFTEPYSGFCSTGATHLYQRGDIGISVRYRI